MNAWFCIVIGLSPPWPLALTMPCSRIRPSPHLRRPSDPVHSRRTLTVLSGSYARRHVREKDTPPLGTSCYHQEMAKTQKGWRVDDEIAELATARAKDRGMSVGDYIAALVREDVGGLRQRGLDAARRFLDEHQSVFDEAEDADRPTSAAHAA